MSHVTVEATGKEGDSSAEMLGKKHFVFPSLGLNLRDTRSEATGAAGPTCCTHPSLGHSEPTRMGQRIPSPDTAFSQEGQLRVPVQCLPLVW